MRRCLASNGLPLLIVALLASTLPSRTVTAAGVTTFLPSPIMIYPVNAVLTSPNPPVFHWTGVQAAISYTLDVSSDPAFTNTVAAESTSNTRYTPRITLANGVYYWRLRAQGASANDLSLYVASSFTVAWHDTPGLVAPKPNQTLTWGRDNFVFSWRPVLFAASYNIEISTSRLFTSPAFRATSAVTSIAVPGATLRNDIPYYWHVQAVDPGSHPGLFSPTEVFAKTWHPTPTIGFPIPLTAKSPPDVFDPVLRWTRIDGAVKYRVQVSTDVILPPTGANTTPTQPSIVEEDVTTQPYLVPKSGGLANGNYIWHVRGEDENGNPGPWSYWAPGKPGPFRLVVVPPPPVLPLTPANGAYITLPRLTWKAEPFACTYDVQTSTDQDFAKGNTSDFTTYTNELAPGIWSPAPAFNVRYYWRVRAVSGSGLVGKWSTDLTGTPWSFVFDSGGPVVAIEPINQQPVQTPVLRWTRLANADHYEVDIHDNVTNAFVTVTTQNTTYTPIDPTLLSDCAQAGCYWYVRGVLADNNREPTPDQSTFGSFIGGAASQVALYRVAVPIRPLPGDPPSGEMPSFCWQPVAGAFKYQIFSSNNTSTFLPLSADQSAALCQTPSTELADGTYQWFVRTFNQAGSLLNDGPISEFTVSGGLLSTGSVSGCSLLATDYLTPQVFKISSYQPEIRWNPVPCAHGYHVYVATDAFYTNIVDEVADYPYTIYIAPPPKGPYYPTNSTLYVLVRPVLGHQADGTPVELPPRAQSAFNGIKISLTAPQAVLQAPANGASTTDTPLFQWQRYNQACQYQIQIGQTPDFTPSPNVDASTFSHSFALSTDLADGVWFWRVRAINAGGKQMPWSAVSRFVKRSVSPLLYSPSNNSVIFSAPVFTWQALPRAAKYEIQISNNDPTFLTPPLDSATVDVPAYAPGKVYPPPARTGFLYWRVRALDVSSNPGPWTGPYRVHLVLRYPILLSPGPGQVLTTKYPVFSWQPLAGAVSFLVEFSTVPDFSVPLTTTVLPQPLNTPATNWTGIDKLPPNTYYWRVRAVDASGNTGNPSIARVFTEPSVQVTKLVLALPRGQVIKPGVLRFGVTAIKYSFSWIYADPTTDTFQTVVVSGTQQLFTGDKLPFTGRSGTITKQFFQLVPNTNTLTKWPKGSFTLNLVVNGAVTKSLDFKVQ